MKRISIIVILIVLAVIIGAIAVRSRMGLPQTPTSNKLRVVTSFYPLYFFASAIGGEKVTVTNITPARAEPHDYEPTPRDVAAIEDSRLVILSGGGLEAWGDAVHQNSDPAKTTLLIAGEGLTTHMMSEDGEEIVDPHVWLAPPLAKRMVERIANALKVADPANGAYYAANAAVLEGDLDKLDQDFQNGLRSCARKDFVTSHAAFGYLAEAYGLTQIPISGISPDAEPSPQQLIDITKLVKAKGVTIIFFESLVSPKLADTIAHEVGATTMVLDPIEGISESDMRAGKNYLTIMNANLVSLEQALNCTP